MSFKTVLSENQLGSRGELLMIEFRFKVYPVFFCLILVSLWSRACDKRDIECFFENRPQKVLKFHPDMLLHSLLWGPCRDPHADKWQWSEVLSMVLVHDVSRVYGQKSTPMGIIGSDPSWMSSKVRSSNKCSLSWYLAASSESSLFF